jgi:peptide chain release factor subunit 1
MQNRPKVLVLTPVKNAAAYLDTYIGNLERLDYPRECLSIGLLEGDSRDGSYDSLLALRPRLEARFYRTGIWKRDYGFHMPPSVPRWTAAYQLQRRSILARSRNQLIMRALEDEDWVLWLDVDVISYPADLIPALLAHGRDILHPHCVLESGGPSFDLNAWRKKGDGIEGLAELRGAGGPVRIDSVGGTVLLVRADLHRDGLIFPPFRYGLANPNIRPCHPVWGQGEIETEGLAMMARDMGTQCWGLPDLEVIHADR